MSDLNTIKLSQWQTPATQYPRGKHGRIAIQDHLWEKGDFYDAYGLAPEGDNNKYTFIRIAKTIKITTLEIDDKVWMVDDPPHYWAMQQHAKQFHGHVLVAGLGLGLIVHELKKNPKVETITVVEREKEIIDFISPFIDAKNVQIIHADWNEYEHHEKVDGVLYDLFVGEGKQLIGEALLVRIELYLKFPGAHCLIHGFNNEKLNAMVKEYVRT